MRHAASNIAPALGCFVNESYSLICFPQDLVALKVGGRLWSLIRTRHRGGHLRPSFWATLTNYVAKWIVAGSVASEPEFDCDADLNDVTRRFYRRPRS